MQRRELVSGHFTASEASEAVAGLCRDLVRRHGVKLASKHLAEEGEVEWTPRNTVVYPAVCTLAGLVAGMFGVGGGIVKASAFMPVGAQ